MWYRCNLKYSISFILLLYCVLSIRAQTDFKNLKFVPIKEGIPKKAISAILQDDQGFIWIGTRGSGLYRYDGTNYVSYKQTWDDSTSINSNQILALYLDSKKRLWVGTDTGLNLFDRSQKTFRRFEQLPSTNNDYFTVTALIEDTNGDLIVGTYANQLLKINTENYSISTIKNSPELENVYFFFNSFELGLNGELFAGTSLGLMKYDSQSNMLSSYKNSEASSENLKKIKSNIESLHRDSDNNLWIGTWNSGLLKISLESENENIESFPITTEKIFCFTEVEGKILLGTENDGLLVINNQGEIIHHYTENNIYKDSIKSESIWSIFLDKEGRIWLGYYNQGVDVYDSLYNKFGSIEGIVNEMNSLESPQITGLTRDGQGRLWISSFNGVDIYDPVTDNFENINGGDKIYSGFESNIGVESMFLDSNNDFWIGTWNNGIYFLKQGTKEFIHFNKTTTNGDLKTNSIRGFAEDSKGRIWMASFLKGLHYYDPKSNSFNYCDSESFTTSGLINSDVKSIIVDSEDELWVGTPSGLFRVKDLGNSKFYVENMRSKMEMAQKSHPSLHNILSLYEAHDSTIWIGTDGAGLFRYERSNDKFYNQNAFQDIEETSVNGIIEDDQNNLWISGSLGITKFSMLDNSVTNFTVDDGLLSHYFHNGALAKGQSGTLYFGNQLGVNYIEPESYKTNKIEPTLHFTDFKLFNESVMPNDKGGILKKSISETDTIELTHNQNVFSIDYIGVNYTRAEKNEYAYFLEGFDTQWNFVGNSKSVTYTSLRPGEYTFKVKASNNDGIWTQNPLKLHILVIPPWWKSTIAYTCYVLFAMLFSIGVYLFSKKRFREKQIVLFERNKRIQEEELHAAKLQFFTNISHEFRTPLTLIINPIKDLIKAKNLELPSKVNNKLQIIHKNSDRLSRLINELMDFRKLQSNKVQVKLKEIEIVKTLKEIKAFFEEEGNKRSIDLTFNTSLNELWAWVDSSMFEKIIFNILSNAFKVTPDGGEIKIALEEKKNKDEGDDDNHLDFFEVSVKDSGPGIDQKEYKQIFKRFYQVSTLNKDYYGSTGIGLEMVKNYMIFHKGKIEVESEIGKGAKFIMTFPIANQNSFETTMIDSEKDKNIVSELEKFTEISPDKTNQLIKKDISSIKKEYTVLIVEDNIELQEYIKEELGVLYTTLVASNGKIGYDIALEKQPDLIITDVVMPFMDGLELCSKIKNNLATSHIPLIMLTSKIMVEDRIKGVDSGADGYLGKPFTMDLLKAMINQMIISRRVIFDKLNKGDTIKSKINHTSLDDKFLKRVLYLIQENIQDPNLNVENLASQLRLSRSQLYRKIKVLTDLSANEFLRKIRLEKAKELLQSSNNYNVSEVTYKVGFSSPSYFTKCFKKEFGYLPTKEEIQISDSKNDQSL
ncbi:two-component regulator propeller domain-containing protein [uncultured Dokdonia sp.]|uniref:hybrid sensor histidine kinase/response regulator transcription factor n=1 Tax=uncultured Dokdonia sp. TaxID=575653 RepID=UPI00261F730F|nr:two-component regulator propeller domain-containing protein [uncultured Dokdonia sp.]